LREAAIPKNVHPKVPRAPICRGAAFNCQTAGAVAAANSPGSRARGHSPSTRGGEDFFLTDSRGNSEPAATPYADFSFILQPATYFFFIVADPASNPTKCQQYWHKKRAKILDQPGR
jgi:hypothetical protein